KWQEDNGGGFNNITDGGIYSGATTATLTINPVPSSINTYKYRAVVSGTCIPSQASTAATLTINEQPEITAQPVNSTICENGNTTFTVNAGVTTTPGYQWQISTNGGVSYSNIVNGGIYSGATTSTLTLTAAPLATNNNLYRVIVSGTCTPSITSNGALLTVQQNPVITVKIGRASCRERGYVTGIA